MAERPQHIERAINFYGVEVPDQLKRNVKLVTLRKDDPKYHGFKVGESVTANCEGEKRKLVVWGVQESIALNKVDPVLAALDGFLSVEQAVTDLKVYPGYENIDENFPMDVIATIDQYNLFDDFRISVHKRDLIGPRGGTTLSEIVRKGSLQNLIKPAIANWVQFRGGNVETWLEFFAKNGLLIEKQFREVQAYSEKGRPDYFKRKIFGNPRTTEFLLTHPFYDGAGSQEADWDYRNLYLPFVLGDLSQITKGKFHHIDYFKNIR